MRDRQAYDAAVREALCGVELLFRERGRIALRLAVAVLQGVLSFMAFQKPSPLSNPAASKPDALIAYTISSRMEFSSSTQYIKRIPPPALLNSIAFQRKSFN